MQNLQKYVKETITGSVYIEVSEHGEIALFMYGEEEEEREYFSFSGEDEIEKKLVINFIENYDFEKTYFDCNLIEKYVKEAIDILLMDMDYWEMDFEDIIDNEDFEDIIEGLFRILRVAKLI